MRWLSERFRGCCFFKAEDGVREIGVTGVQTCALPIYPRSLAYFPPYPLVISSGSGCRIRDADGNEFIDLLNNYTASVHGHAVPAVNEAMRDQATLDRKSTRLNSSHANISYAVFCLKKKNLHL